MFFIFDQNSRVSFVCTKGIARLTCAFFRQIQRGEICRCWRHLKPVDTFWINKIATKPDHRGPNKGFEEVKHKATSHHYLLPRREHHQLYHEQKEEILVHHGLMRYDFFLLLLPKRTGSTLSLSLSRYVCDQVLSIQNWFRSHASFGCHIYSFAALVSNHHPNELTASDEIWEQALSKLKTVSLVQSCRTSGWKWGFWIQSP